MLESKSFKTKREAKDFIREHGGYYEEFYTSYAGDKEYLVFYREG